MYMNNKQQRVHNVFVTSDIIWVLKNIDDLVKVIEKT